MSWSRSLSAPIVLRDGRALHTLRDAADFLLGLSDDRQAHPWVQYAAQMLLDAAEGTEDVKETTVQVRRALSREGLL